MPKLDVDGVKINYTVEGSGPTVVLLHGFASSFEGNWRRTGILDAIVQSGRQAVALDCRGHGESDKPHDPAPYARGRMAADVLAVIDHVGVERADLFGYSMGGFISASLLVSAPERWRSVILAGVGDMLLQGGRPREAAGAIATAMEADDPSTAPTEIARNFRIFAERTGNDLQALAAMQRAPRERFDASKLREVTLPVLVLIGSGDTLAGPADKLAAAIPTAELAVAPGDHLTTLVKPEFRQAAVDFLARVSPVS